MKPREITLELTNYCPHKCKFCSSNTTDNFQTAEFLSFELIKSRLMLFGQYDVIHLSGGEPLAHPKFYPILEVCKKHAKDVIVHSNAVTHIIFNANVIDNIYVEANLTVSPDVNRVHILKRIEQGREKTRLEVHFSRNWNQNCSCHSTVIKPNGDFAPSPCRKEVLEEPTNG